MTILLEQIRNDENEAYGKLNIYNTKIVKVLETDDFKNAYEEALMLISDEWFYDLLATKTPKDFELELNKKIVSKERLSKYQFQIFSKVREGMILGDSSLGRLMTENALVEVIGGDLYANSVRYNAEPLRSNPFIGKRFGNFHVCLNNVIYKYEESLNRRNNYGMFVNVSLLQFQIANFSLNAKHIVLVGENRIINQLALEHLTQNLRNNVKLIYFSSVPTKLNIDHAFLYNQRNEIPSHILEDGTSSVVVVDDLESLNGKMHLIFRNNGIIGNLVGKNYEYSYLKEKYGFDSSNAQIINVNLNGNLVSLSIKEK